eukprot:scaffold875_cov185-Amphora_coffeaeformis.AAC.20
MVKMMKLVRTLYLILGSVAAFTPIQPLARTRQQPIPDSTFLRLFIQTTRYGYNQQSLLSPSSLAVLPDVLDIPGMASGASTAASSSPVVDAVSSGGPPIYILAAVALAGIVAVAVSAVGGGAAGLLNGAAKSGSGSSGTAKEPEPEPIDVSIPYDAAAKMAYCEYKGVTSVTDMADYESFKAVYEEATVAQVTLKKMQREMAMMEEAVAKKKQALEATKAAST